MHDAEIEDGSCILIGNVERGALRGKIGEVHDVGEAHALVELEGWKREQHIAPDVAPLDQLAAD